MVLRPAHSTEQHRSAAIAVSPQPALGYTARMTDKETTRFSIDWRVAFGLILTTVWITTGCIYLFAKVGWGNFVDLPTADIGSFLEGAFAPLAFLWLVIGHFMFSSSRFFILLFFIIQLFDLVHASLLHVCLCMSAYYCQSTASPGEK